jgi:hypothetical protein
MVYRYEKYFATLRMAVSSVAKSAPAVVLPLLPNLLGLQRRSYWPVWGGCRFTFNYKARCAMPSLVRGWLRPGAVMGWHQQ